MDISRRGVFRLAAAVGVAAAGVSASVPGGKPVDYKLGKLPARPGAYKVNLADHVTPAFPQAPTVFGHYGEVPAAWGMLANDKYGCCVWSGAGHEHMLFTTEAGCVATFTDANILEAYSAVTGFDPRQTRPDGSNPTDQGTSVPDAMAFRHTTGIMDESGNLHKLAAYAEIDVQNLDLDLLASAACYLSAVGVGVDFPNTAMDQFNKGQPWDVTRFSRSVGGHYIPVVGRRPNGNFLCVTWGKLQEITPRFLSRYADEAVALFTPEFFRDGKSPEGLDQQTLFADFSLT